MVARPEAQGQGWASCNLSCGDAAPSLGLPWCWGKGRAPLPLTVARAALSDQVRPVTCRKSAWLFVERCGSTRRPIPCTFVVILTTAWFWSLGDVFWKCWEYAVMVVEWYVYVCVRFSNKLAIIYISMKVPYGCSTLPLLCLVEKSLTTPPHSTCYCSAKGINCGQCFITKQGASLCQVEMCSPEV